MHRGQTWLATLVATLLAALPIVQAQPRGPAREIIPLTGDLYRARNGNWYTIFLVTPRRHHPRRSDQSGVRRHG